MTNSDNGGDNGSYEGNSSLHAVARPVVPLTDPTTEVDNALAPDPTSGANSSAPVPALNSTAGPM
ncbi:UNVERIFIED_CONTAM: hypothetical protein Sradi_3864100 [Sesamum radiatum]|uniref:Uncharacterized protein n=1 Tax=Sesamum radiatum TaxID=300843 RepID=A0AAW2Q1W6_SESRA